MVGGVQGGTSAGAPPSALPGAQVNKDRVIPSEKGASDKSPNDALFDAITRGDVSSAQDAINRGADFNARNILGLTPLDESIDLGRNNITFLLLSLRPAPDTTSAPAKPFTSAPPKLTGALSAPLPSSLAARPAATPAATDGAVGASPAKSTPAAPALPASGNAGTPNPKTGFLGFGG